MMNLYLYHRDELIFCTKERALPILLLDNNPSERRGGLHLKPSSMHADSKRI